MANDIIDLFSNLGTSSTKAIECTISDINDFDYQLETNLHFTSITQYDHYV